MFACFYRSLKHSDLNLRQLEPSHVLPVRLLKSCCRGKEDRKREPWSEVGLLTNEGAFRHPHIQVVKWLQEKQPLIEVNDFLVHKEMLGSGLLHQKLSLPYPVVGITLRTTEALTTIQAIVQVIPLCWMPFLDVPPECSCSLRGWPHWPHLWPESHAPSPLSQLFAPDFPTVCSGDRTFVLSQCFLTVHIAGWCGGV